MRAKRRRNTINAWPGSATPGSACSSIGASIPCRPGEWDGKTNYGEWFMEETKMPVSQYEKFAPQFNPVKFDAEGMGAPGQGRRDEIHRHHLQAPRRLRHVPLGPDRLVHQVHAVPARPAQGAGRRLQGGRHQALLLPFDHGLASPGLGHAPRLERQGHRHARTWTATPPT